MKPVIVGMNNPISTRPEHALHPHPPGCAGHRLWSMLNSEVPVSRHEYLAAFERRNLVVGAWDAARAVEAAQGMIDGLAGRSVLLLGREVQRAFGVPQYLQPLDCYAKVVTLVPRTFVSFHLVPHPSGRNLWYNEGDNKRLVGALLGRLCREYKEREAA